MKKVKLKQIVRGASLVTRTRLYKAEDHLLLVEGYYMEEYRRFFFQDIQAAVLRPMRSHTQGLIFLIVLLLGLGFGFMVADMSEAAVFFYVLGVVAVVRLLYVVSTGGYCEFYLHTAAQHVRILGIGTVAKANKLLKIIAENTQTPLQG